MDDGQNFYEALVGERVAGRYIVDKVLGSGGMGVVCAGRYPELGQKVAIKFLRPEQAQNAIVTARFLREARLAAKVKSAHFVRVFDLGRLDSGIPYLVMEMLSGHDLGAELDARTALPLDEAIDYVLQSCVGLAEIHAMGIVHRDIKPSNLFIAETAGQRLIKVLDFGISKESKLADSGGALTSTDNVLGTPQYMAPEQVKASKDVDARCDVWSLGVVLYELLTGELPFVSDEGGVGEIFGKILYETPRRPSELRNDIFSELDEVVMKCLTRERDERFVSVGELAEALRPFAPPRSLHFIDLAQQALAAPHPVEEEVTSDAPRTPVLASTVVGTPNARREGGTPPQAKSVPAMLASAQPVTSMTSSSAVNLKEHKPSPPSRARFFALVAGAALATGGAAFFVTMYRSSAAMPTNGLSAPPMSAEPTASAEPSATAAPAPRPLVDTSLVPPPPAASSAPHVAIAPPRAAVMQPPRPSTSVSAKPATGDLILDRK